MVAVQSTRMVDQTLINDIKDSTLVTLPGICDLSSDLESMFPGIPRSFLTPPYPVSSYKSLSEL